METFKDNGSYNKTEWKNGDIITADKLNKIEDALYEINDITNEIDAIDVSNFATKADLNNYMLISKMPVLPTNVSDLYNDAGYVTQYHSHSNYATKTELNDAIANMETGNVDLSNYATKTYVDNAVSNVEVTYTGVRIEIVTEYPETEETDVLYIKVSE